MPRLTADVAEKKDLGEVEKHRKAEGPDRRRYRRVILVFAARISRLSWHWQDHKPTSTNDAASELRIIYTDRNEFAVELIVK